MMWARATSGKRSVRAALVAAAIAGTILGGAAQAQAQATVGTATPALPDRATVLAAMERTALAQIAALQAKPITLTGGSVDQITANWVSSAFFTGATRLARVSQRTEVPRFLNQVAEHYKFALRGTRSARAMLNADDQAIGDLYQELYSRRREPGYILPLQQRLDFTLPHLRAEPAPDHLVWWWCDALFMAPPVLSRMSAITGDRAYLDAMDVQWWRTTDLLWDPSESLYFRDARFLTQRSPSGKKVFWSRGNGWVLGGLARTLDYMPADYPSRPRYIASFKAMVAKVATLQQPDGLWRASLVDTAAYPEPESSGSAFFVYAMAWGINHGILDRATYLPHVQRGWAGLQGRILPDGMIGSVQQTGDQPVPTKATDVGLYGTGGYLLAGYEIMALNDAPTALPVAPMAEDQRGASPPTQPRPAASTPRTQAERDEVTRRTAERAATSSLAYDPLLHGKSARAWSAGEPPQRWAMAPIGSGAPEIKPIAPPTDRTPAATARYAPDRDEDILWENDRAAYRIYGPALQLREPPSSSGIDAWGKRVRWPFMDRQLKTGTYHDDHGEGQDYYNVKLTRGVGGLGIWQDNKLWVSRNWAKHRILDKGPKVATFEVDYAAWPVGTNRTVSETRRFSLPLGTNMTRMTSTLSASGSGPLMVGIGLGKGATALGRGDLMIDRARGIMSFWEPSDGAHGQMGVAIIVDPKMIVDVKQDAENYLLLLNVTPGKPFVYYSGAGWSRGLDFKTRAEWEAYLKTLTPDFDPTR